MEYELNYVLYTVTIETAENVESKRLVMQTITSFCVPQTPYRVPSPLDPTEGLPSPESVFVESKTFLMAC